PMAGGPLRRLRAPTDPHGPRRPPGTLAPRASRQKRTRNGRASVSRPSGVRWGCPAARVPSRPGPRRPAPATWRSPHPSRAQRPRPRERRGAVAAPAHIPPAPTRTSLRSEVWRCPRTRAGRGRWPASAATGATPRAARAGTRSGGRAGAPPPVPLRGRGRQAPPRRRPRAGVRRSRSWLGHPDGVDDADHPGHLPNIVDPDDMGALARQPGHGARGSLHPVGDLQVQDMADEGLPRGPDHERPAELEKRGDLLHQQPALPGGLGEAEAWVDDDPVALDAGLARSLDTGGQRVTNLAHDVLVVGELGHGLWGTAH